MRTRRQQKIPLDVRAQIVYPHRGTGRHRLKAGAATDVRQEHEIAEAIRQLTHAQWTRLKGAARTYEWAYAWGAEALLQETWCRIIAGTRNWPSDVDLVPFIIQTMRSIANGEKEKVEVEVKGKMVPIVQPGAQLIGAFELEDERENPEVSLLIDEEEKAIRQKVLGLLPNDEKARDIADGILAGFEGDDLRELVSIDKTTYASKRRLIRRTINKLSAEGRAL